MTGLIITNIDNTHSLSKANSLLNELQKRNIPAKIIQNDGFLYEIKDGNVVSHIPECDFIIYLDKDVYTAVALEKCGYLLINDSAFTSLCDNKILSSLRVANLGIDVVDTISLPLVYHKPDKMHYDALDSAIEKYGLPLILKRAYGSLGEGVFKVNSKDELYHVYGEYFKDPLLIQPYIETDNSSIRVLVVDHKIVGAIRRIGEQDFRSNSGQTTSQPFDVDESLKKTVTTLINELDLDYAGIDFLIDKDGRYLFLEINSNAFYDEFSKVTGIDVAKLFIDMVLKKVSRQ